MAASILLRACLEDAAAAGGAVEAAATSVTAAAEEEDHIFIGRCLTLHAAEPDILYTI